MSGLRAKMHQIRFSLGLPRPLAVLNGPTSIAREGKGRGREKEREGKVKELEGNKRWMGGFGPPKKFGVAPPMLAT